MFSKLVGALLIVAAVSAWADSPIAPVSASSVRAYSSADLKSSDPQVDHLCAVGTHGCMSRETISQIQPCLLSSRTCNAHAKIWSARVRADDSL
jgi:hypothetical protein